MIIPSFREKRAGKESDKNYTDLTVLSALSISLITSYEDFEDWEIERRNICSDQCDNAGFRTFSMDWLLCVIRCMRGN